MPYPPYPPYPLFQPTPTPDAISLLTSDHAAVAQCFARYQDLVRDGASHHDRRQLAEEICSLLIVHARIEEEIFYPAARLVLEAVDLLDEARVEHRDVDDLITQLQAGDPCDAAYDAGMKVLADQVARHVDMEEETLFPLLLETQIDLDTLGERLAERQEALLSVGVQDPVD